MGRGSGAKRLGAGAYGGKNQQPTTGENEYVLSDSAKQKIARMNIPQSEINSALDKVNNAQFSTETLSTTIGGQHIKSQIVTIDVPNIGEARIHDVGDHFNVTLKNAHSFSTIKTAATLPAAKKTAKQWLKDNALSDIFAKHSAAAD